MKRSEILDKLQLFFESDCAFETPPDARISAERVLIIIEQAGMLPPKRIRHPKLKYNVGYGDQAPPVSRDIFEWEPEDD